jgi:hypothetical protein
MVALASGKYSSKDSFLDISSGTSTKLELLHMHRMNFCYRGRTANLVHQKAAKVLLTTALPKVRCFEQSI